jgi:hypothetical protein
MAESILGYFGFDRTVYGDRKKNRKWWYQVREERQKDTEIERIVYDGYTEDAIKPCLDIYFSVCSIMLPCQVTRYIDRLCP